MKTFREYLVSERACSGALNFVKDQSFEEAWETAPQADWMIWLMLRVGYQDDQMYRLFGCWCAANTPLADGRVTWDLLTDNRSRKVILVSIDYANGEATHEDLAAARAAAWDAACTARVAARAAAWAAGDAAWDAARAAAGDAAWDAAWDAACTARAAAGDAAGDAARAAAGDAAGAAQARELRRRVDFKKLQKLVKRALK